MLIEVGKTEKIIKIGPDTAAIAKKQSKKACFLRKLIPIEKTYIWLSPVVGKCCKMSRMLFGVGKSEKIIKIGPDTAEIAKKQPKNGLKSARFGDFGCGSEF